MDGSDGVLTRVEVVGSEGTMTAVATAPVMDGALWLVVLGATLVVLVLGAGWWFAGWWVGWFALTGAIGVLVTVALIVTVAVYDAWYCPPRWVVLVKREPGDRREAAPSESADHWWPHCGHPRTSSIVAIMRTVKVVGHDEKHPLCRDPTDGRLNRPGS